MMQDRLHDSTPTRRSIVVMAVAALGWLLPIAAMAATGDLTQKASTAGCVSETGTGGSCTDGLGLNGATGTTISPDGKNVYVASNTSDALAIFDRATDGTVTQKAGTDGCISETGTGGSCVDGVALDGVRSVAVSPDGKNVYAASNTSNAVVVFDRATDGTLTQKSGTDGCISEDGTSGACTDGVALFSPGSVAVSPDGKSVYATSAIYSAVVVFDRATDGTLTQKAGTAGCISEDGTSGSCVDGVGLSSATLVTVSPDGKSVYVACQAGSVAVFDRATDGTLTQKAGTAGCISDTGSGGSCVDGVALNGAFSVAVSGDGESVYVASTTSDAVSIFDRATDGTLTQKMGTSGCVSDTGSGGSCVDGVALDGVNSVTVSPDGHNVYATSFTGDVVAIFDRASDGALTQKTSTAGCVSETGTGGSCTDGLALDGAYAAVVSPDGKNVYVASLISDALVLFDREIAPPDITLVSPDAGPLAGGQSVTITGTALSNASVVTFGGTAADSFVVDSDASISATTPAHAVGSVDVVVTTPGGTDTATGAYTFVSAPSITSVSPDTGPAAGGQSVTIGGTKFTGASAVTFGGTAAAAFTVDDDSTISATTPAHDAGTVDVVVTTAGGSDTASSSYTFVAAPSITNLSPDIGPIAGGQSVTITGTGFANADAVTFGGTAAASFNASNDTSITATTPAHSAGTVDVVVSSPGGSDTAAGSYTFATEFGAPTLFSATAASASQVNLSWAPVADATGYEVYRSTSINTVYSLAGTTANTSLNDTGRTADTTYLYKVRAYSDSATSMFSAVDAATTVVFADTIVSGSTMVKAVHVTELRTAVNAMRTAADLSAATFTDPTLTAGSTSIRAVHLTELRTALDAARAAIGLTTIAYTDPTITTSTKVKAVHFTQLREGTQ